MACHAPYSVKRLLTDFIDLVPKRQYFYILYSDEKTKFREGSRDRQTPEEGQRTYRPKRCRNNSKDEDNSPKTLYNKNS